MYIFIYLETYKIKRNMARTIVSKNTTENLGTGSYAE
jgi:hypothetical protein